MNDLVIYGSGGFAREVLQLVRDINAEAPMWNVLGFLDDATDQEGQPAIHGFPVLGGASWLAANAHTHVVLAIGSPSAKKKVAAKVAVAGAPLATLVHPGAWVGEEVEIGAGSVICAGTIVTTDIKIGSSVIINLACTIGHDSTLEDFVTIAPGVNVSGNVIVGEGCDLGTGCSIIQGLHVGGWSIVGAGAVVVRDLARNVTAVGAPAKPIREREEGWHL